MSASFTAPGDPKPEISLAQLQREFYEVERRKFLAGEYHDHRRHGCPVDRDLPDSTRICLWHGWGNEDGPFDGHPAPPRHNPEPPPRPAGDDPRVGHPIPSMYASWRGWKYLPRWLGGTP